jgi:hypothetical protein
MVESRSAHPFPFLDYLRVGIVDDPAKLGERLAAPVRKVGDQLVNLLGRAH